VFLSSTTNSLDAKGRLSVPANFRTHCAASEALELVIFGESERLSFDSTGRISLPAKFREHAGLDAKVTFVGRGRKFEIWNEAAHEERRDELRERALANRHRMKST